MMISRIWIALVLIPAMVAGSFCRAASDEKPNIIYILANPHFFFLIGGARGILLEGEKIIS